MSVYKRPVVVVRRSTERPEVLGSFAELVELMLNNDLSDVGLDLDSAKLAASSLPR